MNIKIAVILLALVTQAHAVLVYDLSAPVAGAGELGIANGHPIFHAGGRARVQFGTLESTVYFDPIAGTLRQTGYVPLLVDRNPIVINETQYNNGQPVSGVLSVSQAFARDRYYFDTGVLPLFFDSATHGQLLNPFGVTKLAVFDPLPRVNGSWSLLTGGETFTGLFSYQLTRGEFLPFQDIEFSSDQSSIILDNMHTNLPVNPGITVISRDGDVAGDFAFTAPNGFNVALGIGWDDFNNHFQWHAGPARATLASVPEGSPGLLLSAVVFAALALLSRRVDWLRWCAQN